MKKLNKNIVLIGMPGCGKSTLGKILAERLNISFCDTDEYIVEIQGKSIPEIFEKGEEYFRDVETKAIKEICKTYPNVIATGGGIIKRKENISILKENGVIIFIDRPIEDIGRDVDTETRPLLKEGIEKLYKLYKERYPLYNEYCDYKMENIELEECFKNIISIIKTE